MTERDRWRNSARIVATGYDAIAERYGEWAGGTSNDPRNRWVARLTAMLQPAAHVLDLGCGSGVPTAQALARDFVVTGIDASAAQIDAARRAVPHAQFLVGDMLAAAFAPDSFDAIVALYSVIHVRTAEWHTLFGRIATWLRPGGLLLVNLSTKEGEGIQDWLGVEMYFAGHKPATNMQVITDAGFEI